MSTNMQFTNIPGTDLKVSELCLGTGNIGGGISQTDSFKILDTYFDHGGNFIDTAKVYSDWLPGERSVSEKTIGRWFASSRKREQTILATKGGHPELETMHISRLSPAEITADIDASLGNFRTDRIDIYWLHRDDPTRPVGELVEVLSTQVRAGKIQYFGVSNWGIRRIQEAIEYSAKHQLPVIVASQMLWNLAVVDRLAIDPTLAVMDQDMWEYHQQMNLTAIPYSSQANGVFHKMDSGIISREKSSGKRMYPFEPNFDRYLRIKKIAQKSNYSITQVILAFLLSQPFPVIPVVGPNTVTQLTDSISSAGCRLNSQQLTFLLENQ